jgi:hypothetical protein
MSCSYPHTAPAIWIDEFRRYGQPELPTATPEEIRRMILQTKPHLVVQGKKV